MRPDARQFGTLSDAVLQGREVGFTYRKLTGDAPEGRRVRPYHLGQVDHARYLSGNDLDRGAVRTFALPRITGLGVATAMFERPVDFTLRRHLGGGFGVWNYPETETGDQAVRVVFRGYAARVVAERRWHPSQEIGSVPGEEGAIELRLRLRSLEEVARWVLSWGRWAEVVEPEDLSRRVREEAAAVAGWSLVGECGPAQGDFLPVKFHQAQSGCPPSLRRAR